MKFSTLLLSIFVAGIHSFPNQAVQREPTGITVGADGSTNLGGEASITKNPNGSTSVGGESGINTSRSTNGEPQKAAGGQTVQDGNKSGTDGLAALIGALDGASDGKGNSTSGGAKATGTGGKRPKGTGNANANANLPPGVASNSSLASVFGALEGVK